MNKSVIAVLAVLVIILGGVGYALSQRDSKPATTSNTTTTEDSDGQSSTTPAETQTPAAEAVNTNKVSIGDMAFAPSRITVKKGTTVTWTNNDNTTHTVTSDDGSIMDSGSLAKGETYSVTFNETSTFDYHCEFHSDMTGQVEVTED